MKILFLCYSIFLLINSVPFENLAKYKNCVMIMDWYKEIIAVANILCRSDMSVTLVSASSLSSVVKLGYSSVETAKGDM